MNNKKIRTALFETETKQCELAHAIGMHEQSLSRKLRWELPEEEQNKLVNVIYQLKRSKDGRTENVR